MQWGKRRRAFTLVEVLVVIAILGILAGLLFPVFQSVRRRARDASCTSNLQQIGIAIRNFQAVHHVFPPSGCTGVGPGNPAGKYVGWRPLILPFAEEKNLHRIYDFSENWWEGTNPDAAAWSVTIFECPVVPPRTPVTWAAEHLPRPEMTFAKPLAPTDYEAIMGVQPSSVNPHFSTPRYNSTNRFSVMHRDSRTRLTDIRDGASGTIMIVECGGRPDVYFRGILQDPSLVTPNDQGIGWADSEGPFSLDLANQDGTVEGGGPAAGCRYSMNRRNSNEPYSFHSGGMNVLFADGRVQFISETVDMLTFIGMVTREGDEPPAAQF